MSKLSRRTCTLAQRASTSLSYIIFVTTFYVLLNRAPCGASFLTCVVQAGFFAGHVGVLCQGCQQIDEIVFAQTISYLGQSGKLCDCAERAIEFCSHELSEMMRCICAS